MTCQGTIYGMPKKNIWCVEVFGPKHEIIIKMEIEVVLAMRNLNPVQLSKPGPGYSRFCYLHSNIFGT